MGNLNDGVHYALRGPISGAHLLPARFNGREISICPVDVELLILLHHKPYTLFETRPSCDAIVSSCSDDLQSFGLGLVSTKTPWLLETHSSGLSLRPVL